MDHGERVKELYTAHRNGYEKFVYFLMAAAGACIGFALTQHNEPAGQGGRLLLCSLVCWGGSFYFGLRSIDQILHGIKFNLLDVTKNAGAPSKEKTVNKLFLRADRAHRMQTMLLMLGVVIYVVMRFADVIVQLFP